MLQAIREKTAGWIAGFVVALLAIPFALWGINNYFVAQVETWVAKVNDQEISQADFQQRLSNYRRRMRAMMGESFDPAMFEEPEFKRQFLDDMIRQRVLLQAVRDAGYTVPPQRVASEIAGYEAFQVDGSFSGERYRQTLQRIGMTPRQFEQQVREDLLSQQLVSALRESQLVTDRLLNDMIRLQNQTRSFQYFVLPTDDYLDQVNVSDEEVREYYESHPEEFMTPEKVRIRHLELDARDLADEVSVDEATLRSWFEDNRSSYLTEEQRLASHILIEVPEDAEEGGTEEARKEAEAVVERIRGGEDFAEVAREVSDDPGSANAGGDLGWIERGQMPQAFEEALFALGEGEVSEPVKTGFGYHVIKLRDVQEPRGQTFEQARQEVAADYKAAEAERRFLEQADRLVDLTYENPSSLEPAAEALDLEIQTTGPFTRQGGEGIAADPAVVETAFSDLVLQDRINSDPVELGPNHIVVLRVEEHLPSVRRPLEAVHETIRERLTGEKARALVEERAEAARERLARGETGILELAAELGQEPKTADGVRRNNPGHPATLLDEVFRLPAPKDGAAYHAVSAGGGDRAVVALVDVTPGDPAEASDAERERVRQQLVQAYVSEELSALVESLKADAQVRIAEDRL